MSNEIPECNFMSILSPITDDIKKHKFLIFYALHPQITKGEAIRLFIVICYGNIHVLRKHKGGREGVSQMLTFAYAE